MSKVIPGKNRKNIFHFVILELLSYSVILCDNSTHIHYILKTFFIAWFRTWNIFYFNYTDELKNLAQIRNKETEWDWTDSFF